MLFRVFFRLSWCISRISLIFSWNQSPLIPSVSSRPERVFAHEWRCRDISGTQQWKCPLMYGTSSLSSFSVVHSRREKYCAGVRERKFLKEQKKFRPFPLVPGSVNLRCGGIHFFFLDWVEFNYVIAQLLPVLGQ